MAALGFQVVVIGYRAVRMPRPDPAGRAEAELVPQMTDRAGGRCSLLEAINFLREPPSAPPAADTLQRPAIPDQSYSSSSSCLNYKDRAQTRSVRAPTSETSGQGHDMRVASYTASRPHCTSASSTCWRTLSSGRAIDSAVAESSGEQGDE